VEVLKREADGLDDTIKDFLSYAIPKLLQTCPVHAVWKPMDVNDQETRLFAEDVVETSKAAKACLNFFCC